MVMRVDSLIITFTAVTAVGCNSIVKPAIAAGIGLVPVVAAIISEHAQERSSCFRSYFSY